MVSMKSKRKRGKTCSPVIIVYLFMSFLLGCLICSTIILHTHIVQSGSQSSIQTPSKLPNRKISPINEPPFIHSNVGIKNQNSSANSANASTGMQGLRVLVCLASYDFGQFALMEEVLDSYQDFCIAGAKIDIYVHTAIPYTGTFRLESYFRSPSHKRSNIHSSNLNSHESINSRAHRLDECKIIMRGDDHHYCSAVPSCEA